MIPFIKYEPKGSEAEWRGMYGSDVLSDFRMQNFYKKTV